MNAAEVVEKLSKAIQAVEAFRNAKTLYPREATAAVEMFLLCYPNRATLIAMIEHIESGERS